MVRVQDAIRRSKRVQEELIMECKKNDNSIYDSFQGMLNVAEFAATRLNERRTVEFKIFISYMTPLILAIYYVIKLDADLLEDINGLIIGGMRIFYICTS